MQVKAGRRARRRPRAWDRPLRDFGPGHTWSLGNWSRSVLLWDIGMLRGQLVEALWLASGDPVGPNKFSEATGAHWCAVRQAPPAKHRGYSARTNPQMRQALMGSGRVRCMGRKDVPGHPSLFGTAPCFSAGFGLKSVNGLPDPAQLLEACAT